MAFLRWLGIAIAALVGLLLIVVVAARFFDGPLAIFPGGPLEAGELVSETGIDWSFATDIQEIEFGLVEPPRSRTVWIVVHEKELYVPCGFLDVPIWKQWPHEALEDGRTVLRVAGKRYESQAVRVTDPILHARVSALVGEKYVGPAEPASMNELWIFRMDPRRAPVAEGAAG